MPGYLKNIGFSFDKLGNIEQAILFYEESISMGAKNNTLSLCLNNLGYIYTNKKDYKKAIDMFTKSIKVNSNNSHIYDNLGFAFACIG